LLERLTKASNAAMAKDAETPSKERLAFAVAFDVLVEQELNDRLGHGELFCLHEIAINFFKDVT
jgi:hypothetical protein